MGFPEVTLKQCYSGQATNIDKSTKDTQYLVHAVRVEAESK